MSDPVQAQNQPASPATSTPTNLSEVPGTETPSGETGTLLTKPEEIKPEATTPFDVGKLTFPEGFEKDDKLLGQFGEVAKSANVSHEAAQQFLDLHATALKAASEESTKAWVRTTEAWVNEIKNDPNIGGEKWDGVKANISKIFQDPRFATPGLIEGLDVTGAGNNPAVVRFLAKVAAVLTEGNAVSGSAPGGSSQGQRSVAQVLFPNNPSEAR